MKLFLIYFTIFVILVSRTRYEKENTIHKLIRNEIYELISEREEAEIVPSGYALSNTGKVSQDSFLEILDTVDLYSASKTNKRK
jgi:hypothetical protein